MPTGPVTVPIVPQITVAGRNAAVNASAGEVSIAITHVALGTGLYLPNPNGLQTELVAPVLVVPVAGGGGVPGSSEFRIHLAVQTDPGEGFEVGEVGFYMGHPDSGGVLFAVASRLTKYFEASDDFLVTVSYTLNLQALPAGSVTVSVDQNYNAMLQLIGAHETEVDPHPIYVNDGQIPGIMLEILNRVYPPGSLYFTSNPLNPATILGFGTWVQIKGRFIVGVADGTDPLFGVQGATGGSSVHTLTEAETAPHRHLTVLNELAIDDPLTAGESIAVRDTGGGDYHLSGAPGEATVGRTSSFGGGSPFSILNPYIAKYIWERLFVEGDSPGAPGTPSPSPSPTPAPGDVAWDTLKLSDSRVLSNGNKTASARPGQSTADAISAQARSTGKYYFETQIGGVPGNYGHYIVLESEMVSGEYSDTLGNFACVFGDIFMFAVDFAANRVWFGRNGVWLTAEGEADSSPVSGGIGASLNGITSGFIVAHSSESPTSTFPDPEASFTGHFTNASHSYTRPAGFLSWSEV